MEVNSLRPKKLEISAEEMEDFAGAKKINVEKRLRACELSPQTYGCSLCPVALRTRTATFLGRGGAGLMVCLFVCSCD